MLCGDKTSSTVRCALTVYHLLHHSGTDIHHQVKHAPAQRHGSDTADRRNSTISCNRTNDEPSTRCRRRLTHEVKWIVAAKSALDVAKLRARNDHTMSFVLHGEGGKYLYQG